MKFELVTIFPDFFRGPLDYGIVRRAREAGLIEIAEPHRLAQAVEQIDLVVHDPADLQVKTVGAQIDGGEDVLFHDSSGGSFPTAALHSKP